MSRQFYVESYEVQQESLPFGDTAPTTMADIVFQCRDLEEEEFNEFSGYDEYQPYQYTVRYNCLKQEEARSLISFIRALDPKAKNISGGSEALVGRTFLVYWDKTSKGWKFWKVVGD